MWPNKINAAQKWLIQTENEEDCIATIGHQKQTREELAATMALCKTIQGHAPKPQWHREKNSSRPEWPHRCSFSAQIVVMPVTSPSKNSQVIAG